jgi:hypothetical protein
MNWVFLKDSELFLWGETTAPKSSFVYDITIGRFFKKADMNVNRGNHAIAKFKDYVFVFGGNGPTATCEFYDGLRDEWTLLPEDLPVASTHVSATVIQESIFITGYHIQNIVEFRPRLCTFSLINISLPYEKHKSVISGNNYLYLLDQENLKQVNFYGETTRSFEGSKRETHVVGEVVVIGEVLYAMQACGVIFQANLRGTTATSPTRTATSPTKSAASPTKLAETTAISNRIMNRK